MGKRRSQPAEPALTVEEFMLEESRTPGRFEFLNGRIFPVMPANYNRSLIASNLVSLIRPHLRDTNFTVHSSVFKVFARDVSCVWYPDVLIQNGQMNCLLDHTESPVIIAEVLSYGTGRSDDHDKLELCKRIPTLQEYLILSEIWPHIELHRRNPRGGWDKFDFTEGMYVNINAMPGGPLIFRVEAPYEGVDIYDDQIDTGSDLYNRDDEDPEARDQRAQERI
jgi:Uma2 family endonuclease